MVLRQVIKNNGTRPYSLEPPLEGKRPPCFEATQAAREALSGMRGHQPLPLRSPLLLLSWVSITSKPSCPSIPNHHGTCFWRARLRAGSTVRRGRETRPELTWLHPSPHHTGPLFPTAALLSCCQSAAVWPSHYPAAYHPVPLLKP